MVKRNDKKPSSVGDAKAEAAPPALNLSALYGRTGASPLLLCGTVRKRLRLTGESPKGPWEMIRVEVSGLDGKVASVVVLDLSNVPEKGELRCLAV